MSLDPILILLALIYYKHDRILYTAMLLFHVPTDLMACLEQKLQEGDFQEKVTGCHFLQCEVLGMVCTQLF